MGMSASQARLLTLTARLSDLELQAQQISNSKIRLSMDSAQVSEDYANALNKQTLTITTGNDKNGDPIYTTLTYDNLTGPDSPLLSQYCLCDNSGNILVTKAQADAFKKSVSLTDFLSIEGAISATTTAISQTTIDDRGLGEWGDPHFDFINKEGSDVSFTDYGSIGSTYKIFQGDNLQIYGNYSFYSSGAPCVVGDTIIKAGSQTINYDSYGKVTIDGNTINAGSGTLNDGSTYNYQNGTLVINANDGTGAVTFTNGGGYCNIDPSGQFANLGGILGTAIADDRALTEDECKSFLVTDIGADAAAYTDPRYTVTQNSTNTAPNAKDVSYYTNLYNRMRQGYIVESNEQNTIDSSAWVQSQLESNNLILEKCTSGTWTSTSFGANTDIHASSDDNAQAKAEAKYDADMATIQSKDKKFDLELNNINTEHTAVQTEVDSVKKVIEKNIERSFKIFNA